MRRVVTAAQKDGRSQLLTDGPSPHVVNPDGLPGIQLIDLWTTEPTPRLPYNGADSAQQMAMLPNQGETAFRLVRIASGAGMSMHATSTIDYIVLLSGRVTLEIDNDAKVELFPGDSVVQLGTRHAWHNQSNEDCVLAAVIVGAVSNLLRSPDAADKKNS